MDGLSTDELVERLRRSGLPVSAAGLRQDVHRGLISPLMPDTDAPGRGHAARWSAMSVHRARRMARLRKRGVNGHVLPLLLFLADGWGWEHILPSLQHSADKAGKLDRQFMNHPHRVRTRDDLIDNAQRDDATADRSDAAAIRDFRTYAYTASLFGGTDTSGSSIPFVTTTLPEALNLTLEGADLTATTELVSRAEAVRARLSVSGAEMGAWLTTLTAVDVEQGRKLLLCSMKLARRARRRVPSSGGGTNPLTLGGRSGGVIAQELRREAGRLTPAHLLGSVIAWCMFVAKVMTELGVSLVDLLTTVPQK